MDNESSVSTEACLEDGGETGMSFMKVLTPGEQKHISLSSIQRLIERAANM